VNWIGAEHGAELAGKRLAQRIHFIGHSDHRNLEEEDTLMKSTARWFSFLALAVGICAPIPAAGAGSLLVSETTGIHAYDPSGTDLGWFGPSPFTVFYGLPYGLALDSSNNVYVATTQNRIYEIGPTGAGISTIASTGTNSPRGLAFDSAGNLYVAYFGNGVHKFSPTGTDLGTFASALGLPLGLAFDSSGNLYVTDWGTNTVHEFGPSGTNLGTFASGLISPAQLTFDSAGNLYVADTGHNAVHKFGPTGTDLGVFASTGSSQPYGLAFDPAGNLFVTTNGHTIEEFGPTGTDLGAFANLGTQLGTFITFTPVSVPEPNGAVLSALGAVAMMWMLRHSRWGSDLSRKY
jgi:sugar lactone lactonase YvrE